MAIRFLDDPEDKKSSIRFIDEPKNKDSGEIGGILAKAETIQQAPSLGQAIKGNFLRAADKTINQAKNIVNSGTFGLAGRLNENLKPEGLTKAEEIQGGLIGAEIIGGKVINTGLKAIKKGYGLASTKASPVIEKAVSKFKEAFKPRGLAKSAGQLKSSEEKLGTGLKAIHDNIGNIQYADDAARAPKTLEEAVSASGQTKAKLFKEYTDLRKGAGEEAFVNMRDVAAEILRKNRGIATKFANPNARKYAIREAERIKNFGKVSLDKADDIIKQYNAKLEPFYGRAVNLNDASRLTVDANIASALRSKVDDAVLKGTQSDKYAELRKQYGAVAEVEKNLVRQLDRLSKVSKTPTIGALDTVPILYGAFTGNKALFASGVIQKLYKEQLKRSKNPEVVIGKVFDILSKGDKKTLIQKGIDVSGRLANYGAR